MQKGERMHCRVEGARRRAEQGKGQRTQASEETSRRRDALSAEVEALVSEIHALRAEGATFRARRLSGEVLRRMEPALRTLARRFAKSRGSLGEDDLVQVAGIEVLKALSTYCPEKKRSQCFASWATWRARRVLLEHVRLQASDVHPSDAAQRGRTRSGKVESPVDVISRDAPEATLPGSATEAYDAALALEYLTAEEMLSTYEQVARMYYALFDLAPELREVVARVHGIGRPRQSVRELAREWSVARWRLDALLVSARQQLRRMLEEDV
ncbi:hypothetical protein BHS05_22075 [Myxococcus xanthus]|nr:hypothetical protein BHS05_22075 [Myxococcus xanthus]